MNFSWTFIKQSREGARYRSLIEFELTDPVPLEGYSPTKVRKFVYSNTSDHNAASTTNAQALSDEYQWMKDNL